MITQNHNPKPLQEASEKEIEGYNRRTVYWEAKQCLRMKKYFLTAESITQFETLITLIWTMPTIQEADQLKEEIINKLKTCGR